jgi:hypothetical protein
MRVQRQTLLLPGWLGCSALLVAALAACNKATPHNAPKSLEDKNAEAAVRDATQGAPDASTGSEKVAEEVVRAPPQPSTRIVEPGPLPSPVLTLKRK